MNQLLEQDEQELDEELEEQDEQELDEEQDEEQDDDVRDDCILMTVPLFFASPIIVFIYAIKVLACDDVITPDIDNDGITDVPPLFSAFKSLSPYVTMIFTISYSALSSKIYVSYFSILVLQSDDVNPKAIDILFFNADVLMSSDA